MLLVSLLIRTSFRNTEAQCQGVDHGGDVVARTQATGENSWSSDSDDDTEVLGPRVMARVRMPHKIRKLLIDETPLFMLLTQLLRETTSSRCP